MSVAQVLAVRQPWASAIIYAGRDVANRTWSTSYRGLLYIHAGMALDPATSCRQQHQFPAVVPVRFRLARGCSQQQAALQASMSGWMSQTLGSQ